MFRMSHLHQPTTHCVNLSPRLRAVARKYCSKPAVISGGRVLTYAELDLAAMNLARWFLAQGLIQGDRVAIQGTNTIDVAVALLACFHAGMVAVPVNTRFKPPEIQYVLDHSRPSLCLCEPQFAAGVKEIQSQVPGLGAIHTELPPGVPGPDPETPPADAPALILYTSGTTARPKGVTHTLRTQMASVETMLGLGFDDSTVTALAVPMMHTSGVNILLLPTLIAGGSVALLPTFDPAALLDLIESRRCTFAFALPAGMQFVAAEQERRPRDLSSMRNWLSGGDVVPVSLQERWKQLCACPIVEGYGMSESIVVAFNPTSANRPGSFGVPAAKVELRALDCDGSPVADGEIGELAVRSPANFIGYWNDPEATRQTLVEGWLRTGDLGRRDGEGYFWFEGRRKELIIRGGSNISPQEVEGALLQHAAVREAGVVGAPDDVYGERVVAFVALSERCAVCEGELREFARQRLSDYKVPELIFVLPLLPKGPTGKVQRRVLRDLARKG
jgi:long-chain acyl-CoA synthetase